MKKIIICLIIFIVIAIATGCLISYILFSRINHVDIRIGYNTEGINHAPIIIAQEKKLFNKYGLTINLVPLQSGKEVQYALATGEIDIGSVGATNLFVSMAKNAPIKIIAPSTISANYVFVRPDSHLETFNDLAGKTIASRKGEGAYLMLQYALKKEKIDASSITFLEIENAYRPIALMEKKIVEATLAGEADVPIYKKMGAVMLKEWETKGYLSEPFPRAVIAVNTDFMSKNPRKIGKFVDAFIESQRFIKSHQQEAAQLLSKHINLETAGVFNFSPDEIQEFWKGSTRYILWYDPRVIVGLAEISKEIGDIEKAMTTEQMFDLRFEEKLKTAQLEIYGE